MAQSEKGCALFILREGKIKMRLDKFLKVSRLIKRRTVANEACVLDLRDTTKKEEAADLFRYL